MELLANKFIVLDKASKYIPEEAPAFISEAVGRTNVLYLEDDLTKSKGQYNRILYQNVFFLHG